MASDKPLNIWTREELYQEYKTILVDLDSAGELDPQAYVIREEWDRRGFDLRLLHQIDRRFKNLRRKNPEKSKD